MTRTPTNFPGMNSEGGRPRAYSLPPYTELNETFGKTLTDLAKTVRPLRGRVLARVADGARAWACANWYAISWMREAGGASGGVERKHRGWASRGLGGRSAAYMLGHRDAVEAGRSGWAM